MTVRLRFDQRVDASREATFDLVHDYVRRLEWDTLLRSARVEGDKPAGKGEVAVCSARWAIGGLVFATRYVSFDRPEVAAVKLENPPWLFASWAASIRHREIEGTEGRASEVLYQMTFACRPSWAAWLFEPIVAAAFRWETKKRLRALAAHLANGA